MRRNLRIGRIVLGAENSPCAATKSAVVVPVEEGSMRHDPIRLIRSIRRIRVEPLNLDGSPTLSACA
jgi:hypothetical protein